MPEYSFRCTECKGRFSEVLSMAEYDDKIGLIKCPECDSNEIHRDYKEDNFVTNYIKGLHECSTLGEYADKQTKMYGKDKVEGMKRDFVTKKKPETGMKELPTGMTRSKDPSDMPKASRKKKGK